MSDAVMVESNSNPAASVKRGPGRPKRVYKRSQERSYYLKNIKVWETKKKRKPKGYVERRGQHLKSANRLKKNAENIEPEVKKDKGRPQKSAISE